MGDPGALRSGQVIPIEMRPMGGGRHGIGDSHVVGRPKTYGPPSDNRTRRSRTKSAKDRAEAIKGDVRQESHYPKPDGWAW